MNSITDETKPPVVILAGPTAVGKTALSVHIADKLGNIEIISADSAQVYIGMDIATAKPSKEIRQKIPHHLVDIITPDQTYSAGQFRSDSVNIVQDCWERGKRCIITGGTGFYIWVFLNGIFESPPRNHKIREELQKRAEKEGVESLYQELKRVDPVASQKIGPADFQRISRALEVFYATGKPISWWWKTSPFDKPSPPPFNVKIIVLSREKQELRDRISRRVDRMFERGLVDEVVELRKHYSPDLPSMRALGYREVNAYLDGKISLDEAVEGFKNHTWRYSRKQMNWIKRFGKDADWIHPSEVSKIEEIVKSHLKL